MKTKKSWSSFEEFCHYQTRLLQISFIEDENNWLSSTRKLSQNQKNYICKHVIVQAIRADYVEVPNTAKTVRLHDMPKRGRPSRVSKALQGDNQPQKRKLTKLAAGTSKKTKK
jgi:hypothetical protein